MDQSVETVKPDTLDPDINSAITAAVEAMSEKLAEDSPLPVDDEVKSPAPKNDVHDPYFYTNQKDLFTSEIYKIEIHNLPKFFGLGELKKLIGNTLSLDTNKVKPAGPSSVFVCFRSQEAKEEGVKVLNGYKWKGRELYTTDAKPAKDPLMLKRKQMAEKGTDAKIPKFQTVEEHIQDCKERLNESTTPYLKYPYEEQLKIKLDQIIKVMKDMGDEIVQSNRALTKWAAHQRSLHNGLICQMEPFKTSDKITGYRNRCEFTIGLNAATKEPTAGFRLSSYSSGDCSVFPTDDCAHVSDVAKRCASVFNQYLATSPFKPFDPVTRGGHFRTLNVRTTSLGHLMVTLDFHTTDLSEDIVDGVKKTFKDFFVTGPGKELNVTSLNFRPLKSQNKKNEAHKPVELLYGDPHVFEKLLGLTFEMSASSFFQINTVMAEVLYQTIIDLAAADDKTTVLDICCGTGTIGLAMAKTAGQVLGIEQVPEAIANAKRNAEKNNLQDKCEFFTGNVVTALQPTIVRAKYDNIVAVLDPPRPGVATSVLNVIRATWKIKRLVFVACNFEASYKNLVHLARAPSKQTPGDPFLPVKVIPIDLFPHTRHFELVIYMERRSIDSLEVPESEDASETVQMDEKETQEPKEETPKATPKTPQKPKGPGPVAKGPVAGGVQDARAAIAALGDGKGLTNKARKSRNNRLKGILKRTICQAFAEASGLQDPADVDMKEIVKLFANKVPPEELEAMAQKHPLARQFGPQRGLQPRPFMPGPPMRGPAPFVRGLAPNLMHQMPFQPPLMKHPPFERLFEPPRPMKMTAHFGTQTDCSQFMSCEELEEARELGRAWGSRVPDRVLHDIISMKQEEEEAVQKFREGFVGALKKKQRQLIASYEHPAPVQRQQPPVAPVEDRQFSQLFSRRRDLDSGPFRTQTAPADLAVQSRELDEGYSHMEPTPGFSQYGGAPRQKQGHQPVWQTQQRNNRPSHSSNSFNQPFYQQGGRHGGHNNY